MTMEVIIKCSDECRGGKNIYGEPITEVVRCKDCRHRVFTKDGESNPHDIVCDYHMSDGFDETDFCSYGERREP